MPCGLRTYIQLVIWIMCSFEDKSDDSLHSIRIYLAMAMCVHIHTLSGFLSKTNQIPAPSFLEYGNLIMCFLEDKLLHLVTVAQSTIYTNTLKCAIFGKTKLMPPFILLQHTYSYLSHYLRVCFLKRQICHMTSCPYTSNLCLNLARVKLVALWLLYFAQSTKTISSVPSYMDGFSTALCQ